MLLRLLCRVLCSATLECQRDFENFLVELKRLCYGAKFLKILTLDFMFTMLRCCLLLLASRLWLRVCCESNQLYYRISEIIQYLHNFYDKNHGKNWQRKIKQKFYQKCNSTALVTRLITFYFWARFSKINLWPREKVLGK